MTATFKEYVFDFSDLHLLSAVCGKCKSEMILDMKEAFAKMPKSCSSCATTSIRCLPKPSILFMSHMIGSRLNRRAPRLASEFAGK